MILRGFVLNIFLGGMLGAAAMMVQPMVQQPGESKQAAQSKQELSIEQYKERLESNIAKLRDYLKQTNIPATSRAEQSVKLQKATERLQLIHDRMSMLPETAQLAEGTKKAETPAEKRIAQVLMTYDVRPNPLQTLLATKNLYDRFGDTDLANEFSFAMGSIGAVQHAIMVRRTALTRWRNWNAVVLESGKEAVARYQKLYEKVASDLKSHYQDRSASLAHIAIKAPLADQTFTQEMVKQIVGATPAEMIPSYKRLLYLILGFDFTQKEYHRQPAHKVNGKYITDMQCAWQVFGRILITYREEFCNRYLTSTEMFTESYVEQWRQKWSDLDSWTQSWKERVFSDPLEQHSTPVPAEQQEAHRLWQEGVSKAGIQAHHEARDSMNTMLAEVLHAMRSIHARIDVLSVGNGAFNYPYPGAENNELGSDSRKSILIGCLHGCIGQRLALRRALTPSIIHTVFHGVMMTQTSTSLKRIKQLPVPVTRAQIDEANKEAQEGNRDLAREKAARIRAYEARRFLTISSPAIDMMTGESDQEDRGMFTWGDRYKQVSLADELSLFNVPLGMQLYGGVVDLYGELNALRWGLDVSQNRQQIMAKLVAKLHQVANYLRALGIPVAGASDEKVMQWYTQFIHEMAPWKRLSTVAYSKVESLRMRLEQDSITNDQRRESYRAGYRLLWMCIWYNLKRLISRNGNQHPLPLFGTVPLMQEVDAPDGQPLSVTQPVINQPEMPQEDDSALAKLKQQFGEAVGIFDPIVSGVGSDVNAIRSELIGNFKKTGDYSGVINNANRMLNRIGSILPGFNEMMLRTYDHTDGLFKQMNEYSDRLLASMKGMMLYGYWLNRYTDTKIKGIQEMLNEILNSKFLWMLNNIPIISPHLRKTLTKAMEHVSEDDEKVLKQMRSAREKARLGWTGELKAGDIPSIPR